MASGATVAPATPAVQEYLSDVSSGAASAPTSGSGIASYLTALGTSSSLSGGAGIPSHVDTLASGSQLSGSGMPNYLDAIAAQAGVTGSLGTPTTKVDTQVSHDGAQTTITITSVTTVVVDDA